MIKPGSTRTYFIHPLTDGGRATPEQVRDNLMSLDCIVRNAFIKCPQIRPVVPQAHWACLIGIMDYEQAMTWCYDELQTCSLAFWAQVREGNRAGELLVPTGGVLREVAWAKEMQRKEELGLFTDLALMAQHISDLNNN